MIDLHGLTPYQMSNENEECADDCKCQDCYIECEVLNPRDKTTPEDWETCYDEDCMYCFHMIKRNNWKGWENSRCDDYDCEVCYPETE